jgi:antitoxin Xre/MbcA/ParS-like protein
MPGSTQLKPTRAAKISDTAQAGAGLRTFARIVEKWQLPSAEAMALLGVDSRSTYYELLKRARESKEVKGLSRDQLERLSYLLGIFAAMRVLFPHSEESRNGWVSRANSAALFGGRSPLEIMRSSMIGLYQTFAHLVAARAG